MRYINLHFTYLLTYLLTLMLLYRVRVTSLCMQSLGWHGALTLMQRCGRKSERFSSNSSLCYYLLCIGLSVYARDCLYTVSQKKTSPTFSTVTWKPIVRFW